MPSRLGWDLADRYRKMEKEGDPVPLSKPPRIEKVDKLPDDGNSMLLEILEKFADTDWDYAKIVDVPIMDTLRLNNLARHHKLPIRAVAREKSIYLKRLGR